MKMTPKKTDSAVHGSGGARKRSSGAQVTRKRVASTDLAFGDLGRKHSPNAAVVMARVLATEHLSRSGFASVLGAMTGLLKREGKALTARRRAALQRVMNARSVPAESPQLVNEEVSHDPEAEVG
jgi:hypothetical protein